MFVQGGAVSPSHNRRPGSALRGPSGWTPATLSWPRTIHRPTAALLIDEPLAGGKLGHLPVSIMASHILLDSFSGQLGVQIGFEIFRIAHTDAFTPQLRAFFIFCLTGGVIGSQLWSVKVAKRLFTKYRPAYHTKASGVGASPIAINPPHVSSVDGSTNGKTD
jgi:hypothetical protein